ncbi:hypothetical protein [Aureimonas sp. AU40]|uniref:hypothetical protein n=1 Tax=Aureimonas sp. AU40 TaxID=1637747 RepID=UPI0007816E6E|nr:hypothetical protein [Aureimonas sp. AU40]
MEQIAAVLLLVGCNAELSTCREIPVPQPVQVSIASCEAARPLAMRLAGAGEAKLFSTCVPMDSAKAQQSVSLAWALTRSGQLTVELGDSPSLVATR